MAKRELTAERLRELLHYDPDTGVFTRRIGSGPAKVGDVAGGLDDGGYIRMRVDGIKYRAHRLAWLYVHGEWPKHQIDHRHGVRSDNRLSEIRPATRLENMQNLRRPHKSNKSGFLGVYRDGTKWRAHIRHGGKQVTIGWFDTPELAHAAYLEAKAMVHPFQTLVTT